MALKWQGTAKAEEAHVRNTIGDCTMPILSPEDCIRNGMEDIEDPVVSRNSGKYYPQWEYQDMRTAGRRRSSKPHDRRRLPRPHERKEKISVALYPSTIRLLNEACGREARSRSNLIEVILRRHLPEMMEEGRKSATPSSVS